MMTKEQGYKSIKNIIVFTSLLATLGILCWTYLEYVSRTHAAPMLPKDTTLRLRTENPGSQTIDGSVHQFTLSNPQSGLAIIESIDIEVLDVLEDKWATTQALIETYKFRVGLDPAFRGRRKIVNGFKYAPGEVDRFEILMTSKGGFDYIFRFVVTWHDSLAQANRTTFSDLQIARFPSSENQGQLDRNEIGRKAEEHNLILLRRVEQLR